MRIRRTKKQMNEARQDQVNKMVTESLKEREKKYIKLAAKYEKLKEAYQIVLNDLCN